MTYLNVNGHDWPYPKRGVTPTVTTIVDAGRNANGIVIGQRLGRDQYKIDNLEWPVLSADQWESMLQDISGFYFPVTFYDPVTQTQKTLTMYCGDRTAEPYWVDANGKPTMYINCKVNLIDTGR